MKIFRTVRTLAWIAAALPVLFACDTSKTGLLTLGAIDPDAIVAGLNNPNLAGEAEVTPEPDISNPPDDVGTEPVDPVDTSGDEVVFSRAGLEAILGYNKISWTYLQGTNPTVDEYYFFAENDIVLDDEARPQIIQTLDNGTGSVIVLYLIDPVSGIGIHSIARIYSDDSVLVHLFADTGTSLSQGIFVYFFPDEAIDACMDDLVDNPDGTMVFQTSSNPIAVSNDATRTNNPDETLAWLNYARDTAVIVNNRAPREASLSVDSIKAALKHTLEVAR